MLDNKNERMPAEEVEKLSGTFSKQYPYEYKNADGELEEKESQWIEYGNKPAAQLLQGLGCPLLENPSQLLTEMPKGEDGQPTALQFADVEIKDPLASEEKEAASLVITKEAIQSCFDSAKLYLHKSIFPTEEKYTAAQNASDKNKDHLYTGTQSGDAINKAVGVVHAQRAHLLVDYKKNADGIAVCTAKEGIIDQNTNSLVVLSGASLNLAYGGQSGLEGGSKPGPAYYLSAEERKYLLTVLYENLFSAALAENCTHICLPPAGLGVFGGIPEECMEALCAAAAQFPALTIYYNPAQYGAKLVNARNALTQAGKDLSHLKTTDKDVVHLSARLTEEGYTCAVHNPSDAQVLYQHADEGMAWKAGWGDDYVGEEHIGSMSTIVLGSGGINKDASNRKVFVEEMPASTEAKTKIKDAGVAAVAAVVAKPQVAAVPDVIMDKEILHGIEQLIEILHTAARGAEQADQLAQNLVGPEKSIQNFFQDKLKHGSVLNEITAKLGMIFSIFIDRKELNAFAMALRNGPIALANERDPGEIRRQGYSLDIDTLTAKKLVDAMQILADTADHIANPAAFAAPVIPAPAPVMAGPAVADEKESPAAGKAAEIKSPGYLKGLLLKDIKGMSIIDIRLVDEMRPDYLNRGFKSQWELVFQDPKAAKAFSLTNIQNAKKAEQHKFHLEGRTIKLGPGNVDMFLRNHCHSLSKQFTAQNITRFAHISCRVEEGEIRLEDLQQLTSLVERLSIYLSKKEKAWSPGFLGINANKESKVTSGEDLKAILERTIDGMVNGILSRSEIMQTMQGELNLFKEEKKILETKGTFKDLFNEIFAFANANAPPAPAIQGLKLG